MTKLIRIIATVIALYLALSAAASLALALAPDWAPAIITHRAPLLIVEVPVATITGYHREGSDTMTGVTADGRRISYWAPHQVGDTVVTVAIYNPLTNYGDDVIARYDVASWR